MIKKLLLFFNPPNVLLKLLRLRYRGMLYEEGWFEAACHYASIDKNKNPIPWWSYSFNDFFIPKLHKQIEAYEYGSGSSTLFLSKKIKSIVSLEHDKKWYEAMKKKIQENVRLKFCSLDSYGGKYSKTILEENKCFDLIIIDGRDRVNCVYHSLEKLKEDGIIILDDSHRKSYEPAISFLEQNGFKHIYFTGLSAGTYKKKSTSLFYRNSNWLNL